MQSQRLTVVSFPKVAVSACVGLSPSTVVTGDKLRRAPPDPTDCPGSGEFEADADGVGMYWYDVLPLYEGRDGAGAGAAAAENEEAMDGTLTGGKAGVIPLRLSYALSVLQHRLTSTADVTEACN